MISIQNLGPTSKENASDSMGERNYVLKINNRVLTYFRHVRKDGLAKCLRKAADAAEKSYFDEITSDLNLLLQEK